MELLRADRGAGELLERHAAALGKGEESRVERDAMAFVHEHLLHHLVDGIMMGSDQLADTEGDTTAEARDLLAGRDRVCERFGGLFAHPRDDGDACVSEDHERVLRVPDRARKLQLDDLVEDLRRLVAIELHRASQTPRPREHRAQRRLVEVLVIVLASACRAP